MTSTLFVFYTVNPNATLRNWQYDWNAMPNDWSSIGSGSTIPAFSRTRSTEVPTYEREEQFNGPEESKAAMIIRLRIEFAALLAQGIVSIYTITDTIRSGGEFMEPGPMSSTEYTLEVQDTEHDANLLA